MPSHKRTHPDRQLKSRLQNPIGLSQREQTAIKILQSLKRLPPEEIGSLFFTRGTSPIKTTSWHTRSQRYACQVRLHGKRKHLGYRKTPDAAARLALQFFADNGITGKRVDEVKDQLKLWDAGVRPPAGWNTKKA